MVEKYSEENLDTAYDLVKEIQEDIETRNLEDTVIALDVYVDEYDDFTNVCYEAETTDWSEEALNDRHLFGDEYSIDSEVPANEEVIGFTLKDSFRDTEIRLNGEVINKSPNPDYKDFRDLIDDDNPLKGNV
jgi:hypothetical protein